MIVRLYIQEICLLEQNIMISLSTIVAIPPMKSRVVSQFADTTFIYKAGGM